MFNVSRPQPGPDVKKGILDDNVVFELEKIFYGKCYLCEDIVSDPQTDHFIPKSVAPEKEFDWNNLYYSCRRCNTIKSSDTGFIDCCDPNTDVRAAIKCLCSIHKND
jgi:5-methylcytosine-specific restriction endonuclease McrA